MSEFKNVSGVERQVAYGTAIRRAVSVAPGKTVLIHADFDKAYSCQPALWQRVRPPKVEAKVEIPVSDPAAVESKETNE